MIRRLLLMLLVAVVSAGVASGFPVTVFFTNDVHVRLERLESIGSHVQLERDEGSAVLLFDAGDAWQDHRQWLPNVWGDERMTTWMDDIGYDAMAIGNHDTYWGPLRLSQRIEQAAFPIISANWLPVSGDQTLVQAATLLHVEGSSILVIGLTTPEFLPIPAYPGWRYRDPATALGEQLAIHAGSYDWAFVVGHIGLEDARRIAREVPQIDLFISGHSHEATFQPLVEGNTLIVQSGAFGRNLGRLKLDLDAQADRLIVMDYDLIPIEKTPADVRAGVWYFARVVSLIACAIIAWML